MKSLFKRVQHAVFGAPSVKFQRERMAMVDIETFDIEPTAAFYAIGARMFTLGQRATQYRIDPDNVMGDKLAIPDCPDFLQYVNPEAMLRDPRFTSSRSTLDWTMEKNLVEYNRARRQGLPVDEVLDLFDDWVATQKPEYVCSNSPVFDHAILRHGYKVLDRGEFPAHFRTDFDVRTVGHLRSLMGMPRYAPREGNRLHSPLDDCTIQINAIAGFIQAVEMRKW